MRSNEEKEAFAHNSGEKAPEGDEWEEILEFVRVYSKNGEMLRRNQQSRVVRS
jgi:hypothetical protein